MIHSFDHGFGLFPDARDEVFALARVQLLRLRETDGFESVELAEGRMGAAVVLQPNAGKARWLLSVAGVVTLDPGFRTHSTGRSCVPGPPRFSVVRRVFGLPRVDPR